MKRIVAVLFLLGVSALLKAQIKDTVITTKPRPKIFFGMVFASSGSTSFSCASKPFSLGYNLLPNVLIITNKTYHNFMYGLGNNTIKMVNGYLLKKELGLYLAAYKYLDAKGEYVGLGLERKIRAENINFFIFSEFGASFRPNKKLLSIGFHANIETPLKRRK